MSRMNQGEEEKKRNKGYLTVEATLTLTAFLFAMLFLMNMGQVYRAQNYVTHGLLQTGKALAFESYHYKKSSSLENKVQGLMSWLNLADDRTSVQVAWHNEKYQEAVEIAFGYCVGGMVEKADKELKRLGLKMGIASIDFSGTDKKDHGLEINAVYSVQLPFTFFGLEQVTLHSHVVCGVWE